jgi:hypothetical protein
VCKTHSVAPEAVQSAEQVDPRAASLGPRGEIWFGPDDALRAGVREVFDWDVRQEEEKGFFSRMMEDPKRPRPEFSEEDFF